jgi:hypothetical protein
MNNISKLKAIFRNDSRILVEERQNIHTGRTDYGLIATRSISENEMQLLHGNGFYEQFIGAPDKNQLLILLGHEERVK